jgi:biofilm PGA synthesis N-glycosyltransferase PgaC
MLTATLVVFALSLFLLAYVYVGYPLIALARARLRPRATRRDAIEPTVTVIVVAHNEGARIEAKIANLLSLDYPEDRLQIVVGSDGSTDDTVERARRCTDSRVTVTDFSQWRGKPAVLNDLVSAARSEIILFADARQRFDRRVLRELVSHFADPAVGAVSGELRIAPAEGTTAGRGAAFYWRYEAFIRRCESRAGSTVGATGAVYAIRRALFEPIPEDTLLDDVLVPLRIVRAGYAVRFEPDAKAYDVACASAAAEYVRKVRTIAGNFQLFSRNSWLLNPNANALWFATVSHKALRLTVPVLHGGVFFANAALAGVSPLFAILFAGQLAFYGAAAAGHFLQGQRRRPLFVSVPYAMCLLCWATVVGFARFLMNRQHVTWESAYGVKVTVDRTA